MTDQWLVYADKSNADIGIAEIDANYMYPRPGVNAASGEIDIQSQPTMTWAKARQRADGKWCFPAPPTENMPPAGNYAIENYDPAWFPPPSPPTGKAVHQYMGYGTR